jgi:hypothetical protein
MEMTRLAWRVLMRRLVTFSTAAAVMLLLAGTAQAQGSQVIQLGDAGLTCPDLVMTAQTLEQALGGAPESGFNAEWATSMATSAAIQGAMLSGAGRAVPGLGLLGNAVGAAQRRNRERQEAERLVNMQRWYYLNGLYVGRDCDSQLRAASTPAPVSAD